MDLCSTGFLKDSITGTMYIGACARACVYVRMCVCVCVRMCVRACVYVCVVSSYKMW